jgi:hypothetical protein
MQRGVIMGRKSRQKRARRSQQAESPEGAVFRQWMDRDQADEDFDRRIERHARDRPDEPDFAALEVCARCLGVIRVGGVPVFAVEPIGLCEDQMEFDKAVCAAGLRRFIRRPMESDYPGHGTPINPRTGESDPSIPIPDIDLGDWLIVLEAAKGLRFKRSLRIAWLKEPRQATP